MYQNKLKTEIYSFVLISCYGSDAANLFISFSLYLDMITFLPNSEGEMYTSSSVPIQERYYRGPKQLIPAGCFSYAVNHH